MGFCCSTHTYLGFKIGCFRFEGSELWIYHAFVTTLVRLFPGASFCRDHFGICRGESCRFPAFAESKAWGTGVR